MKCFLNENSGTIVKFILTHIVMSILGIMVGLAVLSIEGDTEGISGIALVGTLFTAGFMVFMHYDDMFFVGVKEGIRMRAEQQKVDVLKGMKITLVAYSPVILVAIVAIVLNVFVKSDDASAVSLFIYYACQGSFLGLYKINQYFGPVVYIIITLIPAFVAGSLGYAIGVKDKTLRGMMGMNVAPPFEGPLERKPKNK